jgi:hypothetical protein
VAEFRVWCRSVIHDSKHFARPLIAQAIQLVFLRGWAMTILDFRTIRRRRSVSAKQVQ